MAESFTSIYKRDETEVPLGRYGKEDIVLPVYFSDFESDMKNFEGFDTDIWIVTHPKAGTTWVQEMVWMIENNMDFEGAKLSITERSPYLEYRTMFPKNLEGTMGRPEIIFESIKLAKNIKSTPRIIKSHLPWSLLPADVCENKKKPKIIYVYRNPKEVCVSWYHFSKIFFPEMTATFEEFCEIFLSGCTIYGPFWKHVFSYWNRRNEENVLFITYEDMHRDLKEVIRSVLKFLCKELDEENISKLAEHLNFKNMKQNPSVNYKNLIKHMKSSQSFMRSGKVDSYKEVMSPEMIEKFDKWIAENCKETDFCF